MPNLQTSVCSRLTVVSIGMCLLINQKQTSSMIAKEGDYPDGLLVVRQVLRGSRKNLGMVKRPSLI